MVGMVPEALKHIKAELAVLLDAPTILALCREVGYQWRSRLRDPVTTVHLFLLQILHSNTACSHLPPLAAPGVWVPRGPPARPVSCWHGLPVGGARGSLAHPRHG